jgi:hypothetical protein
MSTAPLTRYPGESALDFANRRLKAQGKTHLRWIMRGSHMVLVDHVDKQGKLDV